MQTNDLDWMGGGNTNTGNKRRGRNKSKGFGFEGNVKRANIPSQPRPVQKASSDAFADDFGMRKTNRKPLKDVQRQGGNN